MYCRSESFETLEAAAPEEGFWAWAGRLRLVAWSPQDRAGDPEDSPDSDGAEDWLVDGSDRTDDWLVDGNDRTDDWLAEGAGAVDSC